MKACQSFSEEQASILRVPTYIASNPLTFPTQTLESMSGRMAPVAKPRPAPRIFSLGEGRRVLLHHPRGAGGEGLAAPRNPRRVHMGQNETREPQVFVFPFTGVLYAYPICDPHPYGNQRGIPRILSRLQALASVCCATVSLFRAYTYKSKSSPVFQPGFYCTKLLPNRKPKLPIL